MSRQGKLSGDISGGYIIGGEVGRKKSQEEKLGGDGRRGGRQWHIIMGSKRCGDCVILLTYHFCVIPLQTHNQQNSVIYGVLLTPLILYIYVFCLKKCVLPFTLIQY